MDDATAAATVNAIERRIADLDRDIEWWQPIAAGVDMRADGSEIGQARRSLALAREQRAALVDELEAAS